MINNKKNKSDDFAKALREIDSIFQATVKELEKLHAKKMKLISDYREANRQEEIKKIRQSLKNI